jgi:hypothetical protein
LKGSREQDKELSASINCVDLPAVVSFSGTLSHEFTQVTCKVSAVHVSLVLQADVN